MLYYACLLLKKKRTFVFKDQALLTLLFPPISLQLSDEPFAKERHGPEPGAEQAEGRPRLPGQPSQGPDYAKTSQKDI